MKTKLITIGILTLLIGGTAVLANQDRGSIPEKPAISDQSEQVPATQTEVQPQVQDTTPIQKQSTPTVTQPLPEPTPTPVIEPVKVVNFTEVTTQESYFKVTYCVLTYSDGSTEQFLSKKEDNIKLVTIYAPCDASLIGKTK